MQQADVTRCGGVTAFLQIAALCEAFHIDLSGHCAPALHLHVACAAPRLRHLEWFHDHVRIEAHVVRRRAGAETGRDRARSVAARQWPHVSRVRMRRATPWRQRHDLGNATTACSTSTRPRSWRHLRWRRAHTAYAPMPSPAGQKASSLAQALHAGTTKAATVLAARRLNRAAGTLALSVLADSAIEHYRGSFKNKAMFTPLVVSALTLGDQHPRHVRSATASRTGCAMTIYLLAAATGLIGHRLSRLQRRQEDRWLQLAKPVLWRAAWRADGDSALRSDRLLLRARARKRRRARRPRDIRSAGRAGRWRRLSVRDCWAPRAKPGCCISAAPFTIRS